MKAFNFIVSIIIIILSNCSKISSLNQLDSDNYSTKEERIEVLKKEIKPFSNFENAEFELFNVNGFSNNRTTLPGASSWNYKFVVKVSSSKIDKWTNEMIKIELDNYDLQWTEKIVQKRKKEWITNSKPEFYIRKGNNVTMIIYRTEGIIFKNVINL